MWRTNRSSHGTVARRLCCASVGERADLVGAGAVAAVYRQRVPKQFGWLQAMKARIAVAVAALITAACAQQTGTPMSATSTTSPALQPGPHSAIANIDLPAGTIPARQLTSDTELWQYTAPYPDTVKYLQTQFATGRRFDSSGATWWNDLPPCYDDYHKSPPSGSEWLLRASPGEYPAGPGEVHVWLWSDGTRTLYIWVFHSDTYGNRWVSIQRWLGPPAANPTPKATTWVAVTCNRS
jgi:hypothetical protein